MVLGVQSRHMVARVVLRPEDRDLAAAPRRGLRELGGVLATIVPDNLKAAVVRAAFGVDEHAASSTAATASSRGTTASRSIRRRPYAPKKKGKVESGVKYVKRQLLRRAATAATSTRCDAALRALGATRSPACAIHGTTGRRPLERLRGDERAALLPLPDARARARVVWQQATVHRTATSPSTSGSTRCPGARSGRRSGCARRRDAVDVYARGRARRDARAARDAGLRSTIEEHLPDDRATCAIAAGATGRSARGRDRRRGRRLRAAPSSTATTCSSQLRAVQAIVTHLEKLPVERARPRACERAHFGSYQLPRPQEHPARRPRPRAAPCHDAPAAAASRRRASRARIGELLPSHPRGDP